MVTALKPNPKHYHANPLNTIYYLFIIKIYSPCFDQTISQVGFIQNKTRHMFLQLKYKPLHISGGGGGGNFSEKTQQWGRRRTWPHLMFRPFPHSFVFLSLFSLWSLHLAKEKIHFIYKKYTKHKNRITKQLGTYWIKNHNILSQALPNFQDLVGAKPLLYRKNFHGPWAICAIHM